MGPLETHVCVYDPSTRAQCELWIKSFFGGFFDGFGRKKETLDDEPHLTPQNIHPGRD